MSEQRTIQVDESRLSVLENEVDNIKEDVRDIKNTAVDTGRVLIELQKTSERQTAILESQQKLEQNLEPRVARLERMMWRWGGGISVAVALITIFGPYIRQLLNS